MYVGDRAEAEAEGKPVTGAPPCREIPGAQAGGSGGEGHTPVGDTDIPGGMRGEE